MAPSRMRMRSERSDSSNWFPDETTVDIVDVASSSFPGKVPDNRRIFWELFVGKQVYLTQVALFGESSQSSYCSRSAPPQPITDGQSFVDGAARSTSLEADHSV